MPLDVQTVSKTSASYGAARATLAVGTLVGIVALIVGTTSVAPAEPFFKVRDAAFCVRSEWQPTSEAPVPTLNPTDRGSGARFHALVARLEVGSPARTARVFVHLDAAQAAAPASGDADLRLALDVLVTSTRHPRRPTSTGLDACVLNASVSGTMTCTDEVYAYAPSPDALAEASPMRMQLVPRAGLGLEAQLGGFDGEWFPLRHAARLGAGTGFVVGGANACLGPRDALEWRSVERVVAPGERTRLQCAAGERGAPLASKTVLPSDASMPTSWLGSGAVGLNDGSLLEEASCGAFGPRTPANWSAGWFQAIQGGTPAELGRASVLSTQDLALHALRWPDAALAPNDLQVRDERGAHTDGDSVTLTGFQFVVLSLVAVVTSVRAASGVSAARLLLKSLRWAEFGAQAVRDEDDADDEDQDGKTDADRVGSGNGTALLPLDGLQGVQEDLDEARLAARRRKAEGEHAMESSDALVGLVLLGVRGLGIWFHASSYWRNGLGAVVALDSCSVGLSVLLFLARQGLILDEKVLGAFSVVEATTLGGSTWLHDGLLALLATSTHLPLYEPEAEAQFSTLLRTAVGVLLLLQLWPRACCCAASASAAAASARFDDLFRAMSGVAAGAWLLHVALALALFGTTVIGPAVRASARGGGEGGTVAAVAICSALGVVTVWQRWRAVARRARNG